LRARGIDAPEARRMLTTAFCASVLERVRDEALRAHLVDLVTARLGTLAQESR
jgi:Fe-S cluster assembly scaffold protein SufB